MWDIRWLRNRARNTR
ncbi:hypothetical protein OFB47_28175 [Escherichia coli]|nr:hypothetical protein [Escherichia coli]